MHNAKAMELRDIPGFHGYKCNEDGTEIISYRRPIPKKRKYNVNRQGYLQVVMMKGNVKYVTNVHRMVALTFVHNDDPKKKTQVHHIDHNKKNNHYSNLQWVTPSYNITMNYKTGGQIGKAGLEGQFGKYNPGSKLVRQYHFEDGLINVFWGLSEAARHVKGNPAHIMSVCKGKLKKHKGYFWRYVF